MRGRAVQAQPDSVQSVPGSRSARSPARAHRALRGRAASTAGIVTTVRKTRGDDIDAACGQLAGEVQDRTRRSARRQSRGEIAIAKPARHALAESAG